MVKQYQERLSRNKTNTTI